MRTMLPAVVLIGLPGCGKTSVGLLLAGRLGLPFRDTDSDIERLTGQSVSRIFEERGEPHFRAWEREAVRAALAEHRGVLALGGGAILDPRSRTLLRGGPVVHLEADPGEIAGRLTGDATRPLLAAGRSAALRELARTRGPLYRGTARFSVPTRGRSVAQVAAAVELRLALGAAPSGHAARRQ
ncbi:shikimate kinase [Streptomyces acidicola]|uniref:Shikimate kinase n=1 Tax=Streptomyces acidicola TaxID=2596892 RepID=A0A5N8WTK5_9ACTN|nr:shikimate kinase [Streptomyces acidicola]MPY49954.1 shikimate kinase [Streptomyces acidicola]